MGICVELFMRTDAMHGYLAAENSEGRSKEQKTIREWGFLMKWIPGRRHQNGLNSRESPVREKKANLRHWLWE